MCLEEHFAWRLPWCADWDLLKGLEALFVYLFVYVFQELTNLRKFQQSYLSIYVWEKPDRMWASHI
jgi:hypothetical protein